MDGSSKPIPKQRRVQEQSRREAMHPSQRAGGRDSLPPYRPYGSLERLARILADIARNSSAESKQISGRDGELTSH